jgi:putative hydrolase of the HAD superfamily
MKNKTLLIDFDGTLAYRNGMWTATLKELLNESGYSFISSEEIEPYTHSGFPWQEYEIPHKDFFGNNTWWEYMESKIKTILISLEIPVTLSEEISKQFRTRYLDIKKWSIFDDTIKTLEELQFNGYSCHIASNHTPELNCLARQLGITKYFGSIYNSAIIGYEKPHYKFYQHILKSLAICSENIIMIGDNYIADIAGARSNGIKAILVRSQNTFNYRYYSKSFSNILSILNEIQF